MTATHHLERIFRRVQNLLQIGRTTTAPIDSGGVQTVQIKTSNAATRDAVPVLAHYGFTSSLPVDTDVVVLNVSGDSSNGVIIATGNQTYRLKGLPAGGVAMYDKAGSKLVFDGAGGITATPAGGTVTIQGKLIVSGDTTIGGISFLQHHHGGVQTGDGETSTPEA